MQINKVPNLKNCYNSNVFDSYKKIAKEKNGKCWSENYLGAINEKLICSYSHLWKQFPYVINKDFGFSTCTGQKQSKHIIKLCR